jgi:cytochrome c5
MTDVHIDDHQSLIKTPKQLAVVVLAAFIVPIAGILMVIELITGGLKVDMDRPSMSEKAVAQRLKPVGEIALAGSEPAQVASAPAAPAPAGGPGASQAQATSNPGEKLYQTICQVCHAAGVAGAPRVGDKAAWAPRLAKGKSVLYQSAIKGLNTMPPKGGAMSAPDPEVRAAVDYMVARSK